ncbi:MAG: Asp-tRNA(Asn)/Glu-tRNA(Gln) amidotransferase subunit GatB [Lachnospiraceae bacterium]|nr:Asp-tRNA(Asn)/Glu-tRNA(Gln) amidotransferase subunit GatB [Lachnospiraceae bacterium]
MEYETVIGLEVHVELNTKTKIFCSCSTAFGAKANTQICPVCAGLPGALPVLNRQVLTAAVRAGLALNCEIAERTRFDRKNYFYPDNPQNYQISQLYLPICKKGYMEFDTGEGRKKVRIHDIHMEEDAGKLYHDSEKGVSYADYNRAGVPLLEIVTEPDMRSGEEAVAFLEKLKSRLRYLGISDCRMQEGSMRADVNLSVRPAGSSEYGTRTEMKNLSSYTAVREAAAAETKRQIAILESGGSVMRETRRFDEKKKESTGMRGKEGAEDYRYFPEPDLKAVYIAKETTEKLRAQMPEFSEEKTERFCREYGLGAKDAALLCRERKMAELFEQTVSLGAEAKSVSNWLNGETLKLMAEREVADELRFTADRLYKLIKLIKDGIINNTTAKEVFENMYDDNTDPEKYVEEKGLAQSSDEDEIRELCMQVFNANPDAVSDYRNGKGRALGFLVGCVMKAGSGKVEPKTVTKVMKECLEKG